eukprot:1158196-Pelagomonas_calceolata.AAC.2
MHSVTKAGHECTAKCACIRTKVLQPYLWPRSLASRPPELLDVDAFWTFAMALTRASSSLAASSIAACAVAMICSRGALQAKGAAWGVVHAHTHQAGRELPEGWACSRVLVPCGGHELCQHGGAPLAVGSCHCTAPARSTHMPIAYMSVTGTRYVLAALRLRDNWGRGGTSSFAVGTIGSGQQGVRFCLPQTRAALLKFDACMVGAPLGAHAIKKTVNLLIHSTHLAGQQLPDDNRKGEDVGLLAIRLVLNDLWRHPAVGAGLCSHVACPNDACHAYKHTGSMCAYTKHTAEFPGNAPDASTWSLNVTLLGDKQFLS